MIESNSAIELSFVIPCLNEARTLPVCIRKARSAIHANGLQAEILVADNGSTDGSREIAKQCGAKVISVPQKGYGSALMGGIARARGTFVVMGDADDSYDFSEIFPFLEKLREGADFVMGCRFPKGGGKILPGAMPWIHRRFGNPMLSFIGRLFFRVPVSDLYCGLRAFRKSAYEKLDLKMTGMEFAYEMLIKATLQKMNITEVPITLHKDGRGRAPHLRTWRDGWRTLRLMVLCKWETL
ncbi:MAG: glycosyltransferase family 2 protein [bacterium]